MATRDASLKRLGGGSWASRDGRFRIESESGRWVIVDEEQTDELGLPRVHGPYPSLTDARSDLQRVATSAPEPSPLAERIATVRARPAPGPDAAGGPRARGPHGRAGTGATRDARARGREEHARHRSANEAAHAWLADVPPADHDRARRLRDRLARLGVDEPEPIVVADVTGSRPLVAEALLRQRIASVVAPALEGDAPAGPGAVTALVDRLVAALAEEAANGLPGWTLVERGGTGRELRPGGAAGKRRRQGPGRQAGGRRG